MLKGVCSFFVLTKRKFGVSTHCVLHKVGPNNRKRSVDDVNHQTAKETIEKGISRKRLVVRE